MSEGSKRLIRFGFYKKNFKKDYPNWGKLKDEEKQAILDKMNDDDAEKYADHDELEIARDQIMLMDYPKAENKYFLIYEVPHESIEPIYYWCLGNIQHDLGYPIVNKITDIFTAAEHSSFYGASAQRLGLAQDKVTQYLATIGKMIKDMFQLVRELRWIDERKKYYEDAEKGYEGAEIALKGLWTDMVDGVVGGQRTSSNIFVMAQQLQFASLPDIFFSIPVTKAAVQLEAGKPIESVIDKVVEQRAGGFNKELRNILKRKLYQFLIWKNETWKEIQTRKRFTLEYLKQHHAVIRMYMSWVKPYLAHIKKLGADLDKIKEPELIAAFEGALIEIEILAQKLPGPKKDVYSCLLATLQYRTRPQMAFAQEGGFHRGPLHQGETKLFLRAYAWTQKEIDNFIKMKEDEDFALISSIDSSLKAAMDALGDDLKNYLAEAEGLHKKKEEAKPVKQPGLFEPFAQIGKGFAETFTAVLPKKGKKKGPSEKEIEEERPGAKKRAVGDCWATYKIFKKAHRLLTW